MIGLAIALAATGTIPVYTKGYQLYEDCQRSVSGPCLDYITGALDAVTELTDYYDQPPPYCIRGITRAQIRDVVIAYLRDHPDQHKYAAAGIVLVATVAAFPCPKTN